MNPGPEVVHEGIYVIVDVLHLAQRNAHRQALHYTSRNDLTQRYSASAGPADFDDALFVCHPLGTQRDGYLILGSKSEVIVRSSVFPPV